MATPPALHPLIDHGFEKASPAFAGGTLKCHCASERVEIAISGQIAHNHACGCSKCWKPVGALFSVVAVVPREKVAISQHTDKLQLVDSKATIQRHACTKCGVHMFGRIED